MKNRDIDEFTDEDLAYARSIDFSNGLTADEVPFIKAYQEKKGIRKIYAPRKKSITAKIDTDILAWLKKDGKGYQTRMNAILRQAMVDSLSA